MKKSFCERLREMRGDYSQAEMARILNTKQTTYSAWETGAREPNLTTLCAIATIFDKTTDWLLGLPERGGRNATAHGAHAVAVAGSGNRISTSNDCSKCKLMQAHIREITGRK